MNRDRVRFAAGWAAIFAATVAFWVFVVAVVLHIMDTY